MTGEGSVAVVVALLLSDGLYKSAVNVPNNPVHVHDDDDDTDDDVADNDGCDVPSYDTAVLVGRRFSINACRIDWTYSSHGPYPVPYCAPYMDGNMTLSVL